MRIPRPAVVLMALLCACTEPEEDLPTFLETYEDSPLGVPDPSHHPDFNPPVAEASQPTEQVPVSVMLLGVAVTLIILVNAFLHYRLWNNK